ncbi:MULTISPECIES: tail fiber assembly protein [Erwinia]|uniref:Virus tail fiber assembly protein lambda gpK n=1 Tax=Erwinia rhapontici TaxID=55212 RepID=A0ABN6DPI0_ERWRD|nr:tail fiber assembly protein [Erwinia rhapontici]BCQ36685.1 hypothetical protein ERHA53_40280 [Erwinia rhapontici]BCQ41685.1 hypothetical protein ERHA54_42880 [Erwinia rhapontici]BCQ46996.1 hypothetical protein ERHA55_45230 [Erwinia rhapontici]
MTNLFDVNGNATETHIVSVSEFNPFTGEFMATYEVRILAGTGTPGYSTLHLAPSEVSGYSRVWNGAQWDQVTDLRGSIAYHKTSREAVTVKTLGELDDSLTTSVPTTAYDFWSETVWKTDINAQNAAAIADAELQRAALLADADDVMLDWRTALELDSISDNDKSKLMLWLNYKTQVKAIDVSTTYSWPVPPTV